MAEIWYELWRNESLSQSRPDPFPGLRVSGSDRLVSNSSVEFQNGHPYLERVGHFATLLNEVKRGIIEAEKIPIVRRCMYATLVAIEKYCPEYGDWVDETLEAHEIDFDDFLPKT